MFGLEGRVEVLVTISDTGKVLKAVVKKSSGHTILDNEAIRTVRSASFYPAKSKGVAVVSEMVLPFNFILN